MDKNIGKKLDGRYEITELIGIGGMADVYKAIDIIEDKVVAVKILKNEFSNDEEFLRRFRNESKAIAVLSHPNIVKIYDVGFTEKIQFIVMEYIDGITLKEFMEQQGILKWKDAVHFIIQILRALQHAHDRGIVHRDIKPQNIMLFPDGTIKVMDFGIARFAREEGKTLSDKAIGSVHYISPEQARGDITDEKSDIYSVGVMLYEILTGQKPFDADNPVSVALMHMQTTPKNPREINSTIPEGLEDIVIRAMQKDASKRYQSASEMIKDIEEFKRNPSIVFEYKYLTPPTDENTRYFEPVGTPKKEAEPRSKVEHERPKMKPPVKQAPPAKVKKKPVYEEEFEEYDDEDEDDEPRSGRSLIVPILGAVTAGVVIIAAFFITTMIIDLINPYGNETYVMPNLIGMNINQAKSQYPQFKFPDEADYVYEYSDYEKDTIIYQSIKDGSNVKAGKNIQVKISKGVRLVTVPDISNYEQTRAMAILKDAGFYVNTTNRINEEITAGFVITTDPVGNSSVPYGSTVTMFVSMGPEQEDVIVPNFLGMTKEDAERLIVEKKLVVKFEPVDSDEPVGTVLNQSIPYLDVVQPDTEITLTISSGVATINSYYLAVPVPSGTEGGFDFNVYVNGELTETVTKRNLHGVESVKVKVTGGGSQTVIVEVKSVDGYISVKLAEYLMNFSSGEYYEVTYNSNAFDEAEGY